MKKTIVFIGIIFLLLLGTTAVLAAAEEIVVKATVENDRIYIGDKTKVGFTAVFTDPQNPDMNITLDSYNFANSGFVEFNQDCFSVRYSSDNSKIAVVDNNGVVTGISAGSVTITQEIILNIQALRPGLLVDTNYGGLNSGCQYAIFYQNFFKNDTYTRKVTITVAPDDRLYLCQPGKEPTPVKITMNAASLEVDRLCVGTKMYMDFSVAMMELNDPTIKYTFNKGGFFGGAVLDPESLTMEYSSDNESVATVNKQGVVTGVSEGWADITVKLTVKPESLDQADWKAKIRKARLAVKLSDISRPIILTRRVSVRVYPSPVMNNVILAQSESRQLVAGAQTDKWAISDPSIAKIDKTGRITGLKPGRTYAAYYIVKVKKLENGSYVSLQIPVVSSVTVYPVMAIHPEIINVYIGTPTTLKVSFDSFYYGDKAGTWSVADKSIASLDQSGKVTGIKAGKTTATFTITATGAQTDCTVVVTEPPFRIKPDQLKIYNGDTEKLTVTYDSGYTGRKTGTWSVADGTIASVEDNSTAPIYINRRHTIPGTVGAKVTGLKPGATLVTFTDTATGACRDCTVTVKPTFTITPDPLTVYEGETGSLVVSFDNGYNGSRDGRWTVDDKTVASIDQNGVVTGIKAGTAIAAYAADPTPTASAAQNGIAKIIQATAVVNPAENIVRTVSVVVKPANYTVSFNPNGGRPIPSSVTVKHDTVVARPDDPSFIKSMKFLGWYTELNSGTKWDFTNDKVTEDMTLYAHWRVEQIPSIPSIPLYQAPTITGPDTINLLEGYGEVHQPYTFWGSPRPISIIWPIFPFNTVIVSLSGFPSDTAKELRIPPGLTAGSYSVRLIAANLLGSVFKTITVNVGTAETLPTITGPDTINLLEGYDSIDQAYTFGGNPAPTYGISPTEPNTVNATFAGNTLTIPEGLTEAGSPYSVTLFATNSVGTVSKTITVNVNPVGTLPTITGPDTICLLEGFVSIEQEYTFRGDPAPTYGISPTEPNTANATLTGNTLTILGDGFDIGSYEVTLIATNSVGIVSKTITVNVNPVGTLPTITGPDTICLLEGYNRIDQAYTFDGVPVPTYGISPTEPNTANTSFAGITLSIPEGLTETGSPYTVTLFATNSAGAATKTVTVNVYPVITINFATEIEFFLSSDDNKIDAFGGAGGPYTFTLDSGDMPAGLTLNSDGTITGTAATGFHDPVTVTVTDRLGNYITRTGLAVRVSE